MDSHDLFANSWLERSILVAKLWQLILEVLASFSLDGVEDLGDEGISNASLSFAIANDDVLDEVSLL